MIVAIPGVVGEGAETTIAYACGCGGGPLVPMGVTTGRYTLPQPATRATATKDRARLNQPLARLA